MSDEDLTAFLRSIKPIEKRQTKMTEFVKPDPFKQALTQNRLKMFTKLDDRISRLSLAAGSGHSDRVSSKKK